jgi:aspartate kinase
MKVLKFGGTSVGNSDNIRNVINIINNNDRKIVIFSAMSGTTDMLISAVNLIKEENNKDAGLLFNKIIQKYTHTASELIKGKEVLGSYLKFLDNAIIHFVLWRINNR